MEAPGNGYLEFEDLMWERVKIPAVGPERIFVEFFDGLTNFCSLRIEETSIASNKELIIPFDASAQSYVSFIEKTPGERSGKCGPGPVDSQPTQDSICNSRGGFCNIGWTEEGEEVQYLVNNDSSTPVIKDITLRLASLKPGRYVSVEVEGSESVQEFEAPAQGYQEFEDFMWEDVEFPPGKSRVIVKFLDRGINLCSISVK